MNSILKIFARCIFFISTTHLCLRNIVGHDRFILISKAFEIPSFAPRSWWDHRTYLVWERLCRIQIATLAYKHWPLSIKTNTDVHFKHGFNGTIPFRWLQVLIPSLINLRHLYLWSRFLDIDGDTIARKLLTPIDRAAYRWTVHLLLVGFLRLSLVRHHRPLAASATGTQWPKIFPFLFLFHLLNFFFSL